jgi:hypothetical protein
MRGTVAAEGAMAEPTKVMGWGTLIAILVGVALTTGLLLGALGELLGRGFNPGAGVGAAVGITGALLISRRRAALAAQRPS